MSGSVVNVLSTYSKCKRYNHPGRIVFSHFQRRNLRRRGPRVCEPCPRPCRGKGVEMMNKTWFPPSRGLQSRGRAGRGAHSSQGLPEGIGIQLGRRNSSGSAGFPFLKRSLLSLTISQPLCSCSCHLLSPGHFSLSSHFSPCWQTSLHLLRPNSYI